MCVIAVLMPNIAIFKSLKNILYAYHVPTNYKFSKKEPHIEFYYLNANSEMSPLKHTRDRAISYGNNTMCTCFRLLTFSKSLEGLFY